MKKIRFRTLAEVMDADIKGDPKRLRQIEAEKKKLIAAEKRYHKQKKK